MPHLNLILGKDFLHCTFHLCLRQFIKNNEQVKLPIHLQNKVNRLLEILEHYENISPKKTTKWKYLHQPGFFFSQMMNH